MTISTAPVCAPADPYLLNTEQAGKFLAVSPETLRTWRCLGRGPAFVSISSRSGLTLTSLVVPNEHLRGHPDHARWYLVDGL